mgnify:CR=1 FL=1
MKVYHAGTKLDENSVTRCSGGRVLAVIGIGNRNGEGTELAFFLIRTVFSTIDVSLHVSGLPKDAKPSGEQQSQLDL